MHRSYLKFGALSGALTVILGAFGAHTLKRYLDADTLSTFQTGITYQFYHSLALLAVGILLKRYPNKWLEWSGMFFLGGILLFSGSLYVLVAMKATQEAGLSGFGLLTPAGGLLLVAGWVSLFMGIPSNHKSDNGSK